MTPEERMVRVNGRELKLTNLDKVLWPGEKITKAELIKYYAEVGPYMLPFVGDRPLMVQRFPNGIDQGYFVQKHFPHMPKWVKRVQIQSKTKGERQDFVLCNDLPTLVWLGNLAAVEINNMLARVPALTQHDLVLIDLDPHPPATFSHARKVALGLTTVLERLKLDALIKTSGAEGIHFFVPVEARYGVDKIRRFVYALGKLVEKVDPELATVSTRRDRKAGRVYVDFLQNGLKKTITAPFSARAIPGGPVSYPLGTKDLEDPKLTPLRFNVRSAPTQVKQLKKILYLSELAQSLEPALVKLGIKR